MAVVPSSLMSRAGAAPADVREGPRPAPRALVLLVDRGLFLCLTCRCLHSLSPQPCAQGETLSLALHESSRPGNSRARDFPVSAHASLKANTLRVRAESLPDVMTTTPRVHCVRRVLFKSTNRRSAPLPRAAFKPRRGARRARVPEAGPGLEPGPRAWDGEQEDRPPRPAAGNSLFPPLGSDRPPPSAQWRAVPEGAPGRAVLSTAPHSSLRGERGRRRRGCGRAAGQAEMDVAKTEDVLLLADEKFDFDLSLSSSSANEDDEVFFGPVGHKERCIAASLELNEQVPAQPASASASACTWSPLTGEKFVEVYTEAHLLALQIESQSRTQAAPAAPPENPWSQGVESFVQESKLKMSLFEKEQETEKSPKSLKRETYYLSDSPLVGTPLSGGQPASAELLLPAQAPASPAPRAPSPAQRLQPSAQALPRDPCAAHPLGQAGLQKRVPRKLLPPRALAVRGRHLHLATEKPKKEVPVSPSQGKLLSEKQAHGAGLRDKPHAALDAAGLLGAGGLGGHGKRSLPVPGKVGLKKSLLKPPGCAGSITRKSSSSSASSATSSVCPSPAADKAKSGELASVPASGTHPLPSTGKSGRPGPATLRQALPAAPAGASCGRTRRSDTVAASTAPPMAPPTQPRTPESGGLRPNTSSILSASSELNKTRSIGQRDSCLNSRTKIVPTPTNPFKIPKFSIGRSPDGTTPKFSRAQRLQSWASAGRVVVHSTPVRCSSGPASQSPSGNMRTPVGARRVSALPTPASWHLSGLPLVTPRTMPRALASPLCVPARRLSSEPRRRSTVGTEPARDSGRGPGCRQVAPSPGAGFSPPPSVPQALCFSPENSDPFLEGLATGPAQDEARPKEDTRPTEALLVDIGLDQLAISPRAESRPPADLPLIDLGSTPGADVPSGPESGPLIDLMANTPDMSRHGVPKAVQAEGQLIDLCSPLIQLSPEADKENLDSPLLKF
ncbi:G2 and S phase-expressed protein 1 [Erethizon dorsatum]